MTLTSPDPLDELLTMAELCAMLKLSRETIYTLRKNGTGPRGYRVGRQLRFSRNDVHKWLEGRRDIA